MLHATKAQLTTTILPGLLVAASCGSDDIYLNQVNNPPTVEITSPGDDSAPFESGETVEFAGLVNDGEQAAEGLMVIWESSLDGELYQDTPDTLGRVGFATNTLSEGSHVVSLTAWDSEGEEGLDRVTIQVTRTNTGPQVQIDYPPNGETFEEGEAVTFTATASDQDSADTPSNLDVEWTSDLDGLLCNEPPDQSGLIQCLAPSLSLGDHVVSVIVTDTMGEIGTDQVVITVEIPNETPQVIIQQPSSGSTVLETGITFQAQVSDDMDRADTLALEWTSSIDKLFNQDPADASGLVYFNTTMLSRGDHEITLSATDSQGFTGFDSIALTVVGPDDWDSDGDGYTPNENDCDDSDSSINPGATEECNEVDDDCDGDINEGLGDANEPNDSYPGTDMGSIDGDAYCTFFTGYLKGSPDIQSTSGTIHHPDDVDIYTFETEDTWYDCMDESGYGIQISLTGIPAGHDYAMYLYWTSGGGSLVGSSDNAGSSSEYINYSGTYGWDSDTDDGGTYEIMVVPASGSDYGCDSAYTLTIEVW